VCGCPYGSVGGEVATQDDKIRQALEKLMARGIKYIESAIADAKREGSVAVVDPKAAANQVYSYVLGTLLRAKIENNCEVIKDIEPTVMAILGARLAVAA